MKQLLLAATLALSLATPASAAVQTADRIVAVINNGVITLSELQQREAEITASLKRQNVALPPASVLSRQVLDLMVNEQLQLQYAASNGLRVSESEIDQTLQRLAAQNKTDLQGLYARLQQDGLSLEQFRKSLRKDLLLDRIKEREIAGRVNVTDSEVEQVLKSTQGLSNAEYRLAMIQLNVPERADAAQIEKLRLRLQEAQQAIRNGQPFAEVAARYSEAATALNGGDMGWKGASALPPDFIQLLDSMKVGDVTDIVRANGSLFLFKLSDKRNSAGEQLVQQHKVRHILIKTNEATSEAEAKARILQVQDRLQRGASFEAVARQFSEDGSASLGGDLGWLNPGDTVPEFERAFNALQPGHNSEPVRSPFGWHLIRLEEVRSQDVSGERAKLAIKQQIRQRKAEQNYNDWLQQLRASAFIDDRLIEK
ncbi:peptidylprolyl isomerase [Vogesella indigofera]|uniref:peptidylprolyl isomerase n=1 Tax=Vogesella indigofera TaxID=45465 RepID=UPI00234F4B22|nr:peptidylprolyl isomerase [Vogesella indigofera]MDC7702410.1 peptidylprolyl isomerase [Vogesella indigofera]